MRGPPAPTTAHGRGGREAPRVDGPPPPAPPRAPVINSFCRQTCGYPAHARAKPLKPRRFPRRCKERAGSAPRQRFSRFAFSSFALSRSAS
ncbi:hypothetical protein ADU20_28980 [Burkholderia pseudomallei]|nr:hypothetical protein VP95_20755 [Burkholderia pseudomallei]KNA30306.1 hypothetical protein ADU20_28980 [Burkholderia pseudomallei]